MQGTQRDVPVRIDVGIRRDDQFRQSCRRPIDVEAEHHITSNGLQRRKQRDTAVELPEPGRQNTDDCDR